MSTSTTLKRFPQTPAWVSNPHALVSLWEMLEPYAAFFSRWFAEFRDTERRLGGVADQDKPLADAELAALASGYVVSDAQAWFLELGMSSTARQLASMGISLSSGYDWWTGRPVTARLVREQLLAALQRMREETESLGFLFVPERRAQLYNYPLESWQLVVERFPSVQADIEAGSRCLALECYTAAVYHYMRVFERGFHVLARDRGVAAKGKEIGVVVGELEPKLKAISQWPNTIATKRQAEAFYGGLMLEVRSLKDKWRNPVSHLGGPYEELEAQSALLHVRNFMVALASRLSERRRKQLVWK